MTSKVKRVILHCVGYSMFNKIKTNSAVKTVYSLLTTKKHEFTRAIDTC